MENFITTRTQTKRVSIPNPHPLQYFEVQETESGERKFIPSDVVKPSLASDFSVQNNAIYGRLAHGISERTSIDPVDFDNFATELYKEI